MGKGSVVYPFNGILFALRKERSTDTLQPGGTLKALWQVKDVVLNSHILFDIMYTNANDMLSY